MAELNNKINFYLENAPTEKAIKLKELLDEVNSFANDINVQDISAKNSSNKIYGCALSSHRDSCDLETSDNSEIYKKNSKVSGDCNTYDTDRIGEKNDKYYHEHHSDPLDNSDGDRLKSIENKIPRVAPTDAEDTIEVNDGSVSTDLESINGDSEASDLEKLFKLKQPLEKGWRRETVVSHISRNFQIHGAVRYYAPGSKVELTDIGQIQTILEKQSSNFGVENFTFSSRIIVGMYLQPFFSPSGSKYYYVTDVAMTKRLNQTKDLRSKFEKRQRKTICSVEASSETDGENEQSASDSNAAAPNNCPESFPSNTELGIRLFKIDESENFYDEKGFLYSKNNSKQEKNSYFRCKNSKRYSCLARAKASGNNLEKCILTRQHNHQPLASKVDEEKFDKKLVKVCYESPFLYPRELYAKTRKLMKSKIDPNNIPLKRKYNSLIQRKRRTFIPKLPKSIEEFEKLIQNYKEQYFYDERNLLFYRNVWKTKAGESNIVFISESVLNQLKDMDKDMDKNIHMLMDGTFKVLPRHIKFRQLYIISIIYEGRCYPLAYILMEKKTVYSYNLIFAKLKLLMGTCEITNFMSDYEAATRKALKKNFPEATISGCYFHYVQAINKNARRFGLSKDEKFESAVQKVCALALLPNEFISAGFDIIDHENRTLKYSLRWGRFKKYWHRQWKKANISVYGLEHRTNNFAESMNKSLNVLAKVKGPNIWILIEHLKTLEMDKTDELKKHVKGHIFAIYTTGEMGRLDDKIHKATKIFNKKQDVAKFLRNITCDDKLESFFKERIYLDGIDQWDCDEDSGFDEEEDFIPNDFDAASNFYQTPTAGQLKRKAIEEKKQSKKLRVRFV